MDNLFLGMILGVFVAYVLLLAYSEYILGFFKKQLIEEIIKHFKQQEDDDEANWWKKR